MRELLGVERRTAAFEHDRVAADANHQVVHAPAEARFDALADGDGEVAAAIEVTAIFGGVRRFESGRFESRR